MKVFFVTGANRGVGLALAEEILKKDSCNRVILGCRSIERGCAAAKLLGDQGLEERIQIQASLLEFESDHSGLSDIQRI
jgi:NAD(P)-dependent dehydrogenase (short-subunit alcohol dehydrogenase family)